MMNAMKRLLVGTLALILIVSGSLAATKRVDAAGGTVAGLINMGTIYSDFLGNGKDHSALVYWCMYGNNRISYCLQYGYALNSGQNFTSTDAALPSMSAEQVKQLQYCLYYGYQADAYGICPHDNGVTCEKEWIPYAATQAMVWIIVADKYNNADAVSQWGAIVANATNYSSQILAEYQALYARMEAAMKMAPPSFSETSRTKAPLYTMEWDATEEAYLLTLTDTNAVLGSYDRTLPSGVTATRSGNRITFRTTTEISEASEVRFVAKSGTSANREVSSLVFWQPTDAGKQNQVQCSSVTYDPLEAYLYLKTGEKPIESTHYRFIKTDEHGKVLPGCRFQLLDASGNVVDSWTTDSTGVHEVSDVLVKGETYTLRELDCPIGYGKATDHRFTAVAGEDWIEITTKNTQIKASVTVSKVDAEGKPLSGAQYTLMTTQAISGAATLTYKGKIFYALKTNTVKDGKLVFNGLDATRGYSYLIVEQSSPDGYSLLKEPIELGTLPAKIEGSVSEKYKGQIQIKDDAVYLYDLNYRVINSANLTLPLTGEADAFAGIPFLFAAMALMVVVAVHKNIKQED